MHYVKQNGAAVFKSAVKGMYDITQKIMSNNNITELGLTGLVSSSGLVFNSPIKPLNDYIKAGHFLETGNISKDNRYFLFFVEK